MNEGIVKFFNEVKGFGFINDFLIGNDVFVYVLGLVNYIKENDQVSFDVECSLKGLNVVNVWISI